MLVIHPDECINCGVCVPECPAKAIFADNEVQTTAHWLDVNRKYAEIWPNITAKKSPFPGADTENGRAGKATDLSPDPAEPEEVL